MINSTCRISNHMEYLLCTIEGLGRGDGMHAFGAISQTGTLLCAGWRWFPKGTASEDKVLVVTSPLNTTPAPTTIYQGLQGNFTPNILRFL